MVSPHYKSPAARQILTYLSVGPFFWVLALFLILACNDDNNSNSGGNNSGTPAPSGQVSEDSTGPNGSSAPPLYVPLIHRDTGAPIGLEVFISIGGVRGGSDSLAGAQLEAGYRAAGFRVHTVFVALSFTPIQAEMNRVAAEYRTTGATLHWAVFHHAGHGWDDHISYESAAGQRGSTKHTAIFAALGSTFPKTTPQFTSTQFGAVFDACGQGAAAGLRVGGGRNGYVATASPTAVPASQCQTAGCSYVCENCWSQTIPTYTYSANFARVLQVAPPPLSQIVPAMHGAHDAGVIALERGGSPSTGCGGRFTRY